MLLRGKCSAAIMGEWSFRLMGIFYMYTGIASYAHASSLSGHESDRVCICLRA